jgi:hypothetical protein
MAGAAWSPNGKLGRPAIGFPAAGGVETQDSVIDTRKSYTVSAWVKLNSFGRGLKTFVTVDGANVSGFYLQMRDTELFAFTVFPGDNTAGYTFASARSLPQLGVWYHLVGVYDARAHLIGLYVNGQLQATQPYSDAWLAAGHFVIGRGKFGGKYVDFATECEIADVRAYDIALSPDAVAKLYDAGR